MTFEMITPPVKRRAVAYPALVPGSQEWDEKRRTLIGASEVPALFAAVGDDGYKGRFSLWLTKTGKSVEEERAPDSPAAIGREFEAGIARIYQRVKYETVGFIQPAWTEHDDVVPFLAATPDYDCFEEPWEEKDRTHAVQIKNRGGFPRGWGEQGTDQVPRAVLIQVHAELTVTQLPFIDVAAVLSGNQFAHYRIHWDEEVASNIRDVVSQFWNQHVVTDLPPEIGGPGANEYFDSKYGKATTEVVRLAETEAERAAVIQFFLSHGDKKGAELRLDDSKAVLKSLVGTDYGLELPGTGKVLWYNQSGRRTITEASLREALVEGLHNVGPVEIDKIVERATKIGNPSRTFMQYPAKGK